MEHPILFSTPMVKAILEGRKTQTRRTVKPQPEYGIMDCVFTGTGFGYKDMQGRCTCQEVKCPYGKVGDVLWVRETWMVTSNGTYWYKASFKNDFDFKNSGLKLRPSIFMPKAACRIFLEITDIRVERLQDISEDDAKAEGVETLGLYPGYDVSSSGKFEGLWNLINGEESWNQNPFVWVIEFKRIEKPTL